MSRRFKRMTRRQRNRHRHEFEPYRSWDESAVFCRRCSQSEGSWQHSPRQRWWRFWLRDTHRVASPSEEEA